MPSGRYSTYNEDVQKKAEEYLQQCVDEPYRLVRTEGKDSTTWENKVRINLPSIEGLALALDISRETVYDWEGKYPSFSDITEKVRAEQAKKLMQGGLEGTYNPTIAKVLLAKHGYREGVDMTSDGKPISFVVPKEIADKNGIPDASTSGDSQR